jgi:CRP/FNR family transcriptional regulator, anaerobic regulatory protein
MANLIPFFNQFSTLDDIATADLLLNAVEKKYKKGDYIFREGKFCEHLYFVNEGLVKCFFYNESMDKEFILGFLPENAMFSLYDSASTQQISNFNIIALENTTITLVRYDKMEDLCKKHHCIETFYRKLITQTAIGVMRLLCEMMEDTTTDRYKNFLEKYGNTMQRVSLGDMSKLFGITQQSLSRIRAKK